MTTSKSLSAEELDAIEARANAATPAPWTAMLGSGNHLCTGIHYEDIATGTSTLIADTLPDYFLDETQVIGWPPKDHVQNMEFIMSARSDVPRLVSEVRRQRAELTEVLAYLDAIIAAYQQPGIGSLIFACRIAKEWRGIKDEEA